MKWVAQTTLLASEFTIDPTSSRHRTQVNHSVQQGIEDFLGQQMCPIDGKRTTRQRWRITVQKKARIPFASFPLGLCGDNVPPTFESCMAATGETVWLGRLDCNKKRKRDQENQWQ